VAGVESEKKLLAKLSLCLVLTICPLRQLYAQSLAPRAYVITPEHANAITLTSSFYDGGLNFDATIPITGATGTYGVPTFSYYHSFRFFGRSANFTVLCLMVFALSRVRSSAPIARFTDPGCSMLNFASQ
jgi:hypothetical protein